MIGVAVYGGVGRARLLDAAERVRDELRAHNVALGYVVVALPQDPKTLAVAVEAFPGDDAVDFIGLQGFESGYGADSITFNELFTTTATVFRRITDLPVLVTDSEIVASAVEQSGLEGGHSQEILACTVRVLPANAASQKRSRYSS